MRLLYINKHILEYERARLQENTSSIFSDDDDLLPPGFMNLLHWINRKEREFRKNELQRVNSRAFREFSRVMRGNNVEFENAVKLLLLSVFVRVLNLLIPFGHWIYCMALFGWNTFDILYHILNMLYVVMTLWLLVVGRKVLCLSFSSFFLNNGENPYDGNVIKRIQCSAMLHVLLREELPSEICLIIAVYTGDVFQRPAWDLF